MKFQNVILNIRINDSKYNFNIINNVLNEYNTIVNTYKLYNNIYKTIDYHKLYKTLNLSEFNKLLYEKLDSLQSNTYTLPSPSLIYELDFDIEQFDYSIVNDYNASNMIRWINRLAGGFYFFSRALFTIRTNGHYTK